MLLYQDNSIIKHRNWGFVLISYEPLWRTMKAQDITTYTLIYKHGISSRTIYNLKHNKGITVYTIERLCEILNCTPNDVISFIKE